MPNKDKHFIGALIVFLFLAGAPLAAKGPEGTMAIRVSMAEPGAHYYHVEFRCEGLDGASFDFKMPAWTTGFYKIQDYARNVLGFEAADGTGRPLPWEKTTKNTWRVKKGGSAAVVVSYDVYAFNLFCADSYLGDDRGFLLPSGVFMYVDGLLRHPVSITVEPYSAWKDVVTGLDPVEGRPRTFSAPDFDILYDAPILMGNLVLLTFEVRGIPHVFAAHPSDLGSVDRPKFTADLKRMVESAVAIFDDIPYKRYAFLAIGPGGGGIEHLNSTALAFNGAGLDNPAAYTGWLCFVAHEYFHNYNVKRIRPIALGPFDYDRENYTRMLWVSEGFTSYYEYLVLNRAGLLPRDKVLEMMSGTIARYENVPGRLHQSATEASFDTWIQFFNRGENAANTTISYYDKGAALGMLLDLEIRNDTGNRKSLDDVMRLLYRRYYRDKGRGFTDAEFRQACEEVAGRPLDEIFEYASTVKPVDYSKFLGYAGLAIDAGPPAAAGAFLGATTRTQDGNLVISGVETGSPASKSGLSAQDEIVALDGARASARSLGAFLDRRKPGDRIRITISRRGEVRDVEAVLGIRPEKTFAIKPLASATPLQSSIFEAWLIK
jgi:predicted metalloprotease with PDZ domain